MDLPIVITGGNGSIGSYMPESCYKLETRLENSVEEIKSDIRSLISNPYVLIHFAALTSLPICEDNPEKAHLINVTGSKKIFQAALQTGCKRFIFISTSHVYSRPNSNQPINIDHPIGPQSVYGKTKAEAEEALRALAKNENIKLVVARVFSVLSKKLRPGFLLTGLHTRAKNKDFSPIPGFLNVRDFLSAEDVCKKLIALTKLDDPPEFANICSGKGRTIKSLADEVFSEYDLDSSQIVSGPTPANNVESIIGVPSI